MRKKMTNERRALREEAKMQRNSTHSKHYYSSDAEATGSPSAHFASSTPHTPTPRHFSIVRASSLPSIEDADSESEAESMITSIYERPSPLPIHPNLKRNHDTVDDSIQTPPHKVLKLDANFTSNQSTLATPNLRTPTGIMTCTPGQSKNTPSSGRWPAFMYTIDMSDGFAAMESTEMKTAYRRLEDRFQAVFHVPFVHSTYHDARRRWTRASDQGLLEEAEAAAYTEDGRWSKLAACVPLK
jgi:hypothetical protein